MVTFTYKDYIKYIRYEDEIKEILIRLEEKENLEVKHNVEKMYILHEETQNYITEGEMFESKETQRVVFVNNEHDKIFRKSLDNKNEAAKFLNKTLKLKQKIVANDLEKYNSSFVTKELRNQESDVIYKLKDKNIFFLLEHQTKIDYSMPFRILEYQLEIMKSAIDFKQIRKKGYKYPTVIAIVLHTGGGEIWDGKTYLDEAKDIFEECENIGIGKFIVVDVNDFSEEELLEDDSFLSKAMLIEKTRNTESLGLYLQKIVEIMNTKKDIYTKEQKELLSSIIGMILRRKIGDNLSEKLIKELNKKEEKDMLAVLEMIDRENAMLLRKGRKEGERKAKLETAKKMLKKGIDMETIIDITGLSKEKILK